MRLFIKNINLNSVCHVLFVFVIVVSLFKLKLFFSEYSNFNEAIIKIIVSGIIIFLAIRLNIKFNHFNFIHTLNSKRDLKFEILLVLMLIAIYLLFSFANKRLIETDIPGWLLLFAAIFLAAAAEEFIFRYYFVNFLVNRKVSIEKAGIISSFLFSIAHLSNILSSEVLSVINQVIFAFFTGLLLFSIMVLFKNLFYSIIYHFLINIPIKVILSENSITTVEEGSNFMNDMLSFFFTHIFFAPFYIVAIVLYKRVAVRQENI